MVCESRWHQALCFLNQAGIIIELVSTVCMCVCVSSVF